MSEQPLPAELVAEERQLNDTVRASLSLQGDSGVQPRLVTHYAYPARDLPEPATFDAVAVALRDLGFDTGLATADAGIVFENIVPVATGAFDSLTAKLGLLLGSMQWVYDGWECPTVPDK